MLPLNTNKQINTNMNGYSCIGIKTNQMVCLMVYFNRLAFHGLKFTIDNRTQQAMKMTHISTCICCIRICYVSTNKELWSYIVLNIFTLILVTHCCFIYGCSIILSKLVKTIPITINCIYVMYVTSPLTQTNGCTLF